MTEDLRTMLRERADTAGLAPVDVEALTRAGTLAVRRRRLATVAAVAAAVAAVAGTSALVRPDPTPEPAPPTPPTPTAARPSWANGTTLHTPTGEVEVGHAVRGLVRTSAGQVVSDGQSVFSVVGDRVQEVGAVSAPRAEPGWARLFGDTDGTLAAWPDGSAYVVLDQGTGEVRRFGSVGPGAIVAVDGRTVYVSDDRGVIAVDVDTEAEAQVARRGAREHPVTVEDGVAVRRTQDGRFTVDGAGTVGPRPVTLADALATTAQLSPDARFLIVDTTVAARVFDTATGRQVPLPLAEGETTGYEWLDDDTLAVLQLPTPASHYRLLTCSVSTLDCEVAVPDLGDGKDEGGNGVDFALPTGEPFLPYPHG